MERSRTASKTASAASRPRRVLSIFEPFHSGICSGCFARIRSTSSEGKPVVLMAVQEDIRTCTSILNRMNSRVLKPKMHDLSAIAIQTTI